MWQVSPTCRMWLFVGWLATLAFNTLQTPASGAEPIAVELLRERAERSLRLIERSADEYLEQRECFSCHHQTMAVMTSMEARRRGLEVDYDNLERQVRRTVEHLHRGEQQYKQGQGQGGKVDTAGYALLALATAGWPADATTEAVTEYLLQAHADDGYWNCSSNRPPTEANDITTSALALKGLAAYAGPSLRERAKRRSEACREWLAARKPEDNEQRVFCLLAAKQLGEATLVKAMRDAILANQRNDGGWSQTAEMSSDAYATGTALFALVQSGYDVSENAYQRGLRYLIETQLDDGSWHVATRSRPIQKYFESGYPHGVDQFISISASGWSTIAILSALPIDEARLAKLPALSWQQGKDAFATKSSPDAEAIAAALAAVPSAADSEFFERDIRPLLIEKCASCHGPDEQSADLRVDSLSALLTGGESGPALIPRSANRSLMIKAVRREGELKMPPDDPLNSGEIEKLEKWIERGAPWPKGEPPALSARESAAKSHWAFQPIQEPPVPDVRNVAWPENEVDRFVLAKLEQNELSPAPQAHRRALLRRVAYDLTGLPPTADELDAFASDERPDAYERVVDRLLASPKFGEQWGRHWLDIARYSDTKGYVYAREERFFVHAAAYRDWVIDAFAEDLAFDRFVMLQLAADQVAADDTRAQAAMGFLTLGRRFLGVTHDIIDDRIDVVTRGLQGLTVACARCHDHKFDPIPTADYYALYGVFLNATEQRVQLPRRTDDASPDSATEKPLKDFEAELTKRQTSYRERLAAERAVAADRVRARITDYLWAQLEIEKYPAEGFDIIIAKDDLVPAHVRRFRATMLDAAERDDAIFSAWRMYEGLIQPPQTIADDFSSEAAAAVTARLAQLPSDRLNRLVQKKFATPPRSMREVVERYGELFSELKDFDPSGESNAATAPSTDNASSTETESESNTETETKDKTELDIASDLGEESERLARVELLEFWRGPKSPCEVPDEDIVSIEQYVDSGTCDALWKLQGEIDRWINQSAVAPPFATVLVDRQQIREPHIFRRGNPLQVGDRVPRQFLSVFREQAGTVSTNTVTHQSVKKFQTARFQRGSGRRELAEAIVDPRNPLTARVWTNRIWQHLFGQGLVTTPSDFGVRAGMPSHPELLDWLASDLLAQQQSTKRIIRQLVLSNTYQQSAQSSAEESESLGGEELDPENRLLSHATPKRLSFEQQRDTWLAIAGQLDLSRGGRAEPLFEGKKENCRRTIYGLIDRQFLPGVLRVFDFANPDLHTPERSQTTVPQQALFELNHAFIARVASGTARASAAGASKLPTDRRIDNLFRLVLGRSPGSQEMEVAQAFLAQPAEPTPQVKPQSLAWQYGYAAFDPEAGTIRNFKRLPHFDGKAWQGGAQWPDPKLGWVQLTASGGHAGNDLKHAAVRRWTAPRGGVLNIRSTATHNAPAGDGIRCTIVSSRGGQLKSTPLHDASADLHVEAHQVEAGDTLDFVVDFLANLNNDQFTWSAELTLQNSETQSATASSPSETSTDALRTNSQTTNLPSDSDPAEPRVWNAEQDFQGPITKLLDPWEQLAQVLLLSNELIFFE